MRYAYVVASLFLLACNRGERYGGGEEDLQTQLQGTAAGLNQATFFGVVEITESDQCPFAAEDGHPSRPPDDNFFCPNEPSNSRFGLQAVEPLIGQLGSAVLVDRFAIDGPWWSSIRAFFEGEHPTLLVQLQVFAPTESVHNLATPNFCGVADNESVAHFTPSGADHTFVVHDGKAMWIGNLAEQFSSNGGPDFRSRMLADSHNWRDIHELFDSAIELSNSQTANRPVRLNYVPSVSLEDVRSWEDANAPAGRWVARTPVLDCAWVTPAASSGSSSTGGAQP